MARASKADTHYRWLAGYFSPLLVNSGIPAFNAHAAGMALTAYLHSTVSNPDFAKGVNR